MTSNVTQMSPPRREMAYTIRCWILASLSLVFVILYGAALLGWIKLTTDDKMITRLEPIIFVVIGYYFGRSPAQQTERNLKYEINRQSQRADAAQHAKEQTQQAREALEEKVKNARITLAWASGSAVKSSTEDVDRRTDLSRQTAVRQSVASAVAILSS